jgi:hypothetical protein
MRLGFLKSNFVKYFEDKVKCVLDVFKMEMSTQAQLPRSYKKKGALIELLDNNKIYEVAKP